MLMPFSIADEFSDVMKDILPGELINMVVNYACKLYAAEHVRGPIVPALYNNPRFRVREEKCGSAAHPEIGSKEINRGKSSKNTTLQRWCVMTNLMSWFVALDRWNQLYYCRRKCLRNWGWFARYLSAGSPKERPRRLTIHY